MPAAREATGCLDAAGIADSVDPAPVDIFKLRATQDDLDAWRATAPVPDTDIGVELGQMKEYVVARSRIVFEE